MHIIDLQLKKRQEQNKLINVGLIGIGEMGKGLLNQIQNYTPGMTVAAIYNRSIDKAVNACKALGINDFVIADSKEKFSAANNIRNKIIITNDVDLVIGMNDVDAIVEMTGNISFGLDTILKSFDAKKNVVSFNAELEATLGPYLKKQAAIKGVKYTLGDGDQPGVTLNLWRHVKMMGFEPLVCGNIKGLQDHYRNPTTQESFAKQWDMTPEMVTSFADGTKISFEQACIANATNMTIAKTGMIGPNEKKHVDELVESFGSVKELQELGGIVDYVVGAQPGPGVFVYATTKDPVSVKYLRYGKLGEGPLYSFYVPYHLLFFELAFSIARLVDFDDITLDAEYGYKVEVIAVAKEDLKAGDKIDGLGGYKTYGICERSEIVSQEAYLPMGLAEGCVLRNNVQKDQIINLNDVEYNKSEQKFTLYKS